MHAVVDGEHVADVVAVAVVVFGGSIFAVV